MSKIMSRIGRRGRDQNQLPDAVEIPHDQVMRLAASHGWDCAILLVRREGEYGGHQVVTSGIGVRNGKIAQEMGEIIKGMLGWKEVDAAADAELEAAKKEMAEGPDGGDQETGKKLIMPAIEKTRGDAKRAKERKGIVKYNH